MRRLLFVSALALLAIPFLSTPAQAQVAIGVGVRIGGPPVRPVPPPYARGYWGPPPGMIVGPRYVGPPPVVYRRPPRVIYAQPPVIIESPPVVVESPPVVVAPSR